MSRKRLFASLHIFNFLSSSWISRSISSRSSGSKLISDRRLFRASNCCWQRYSSQDKAIYQVLTDFCGFWTVYSRAKSALLRLVLMGVFVQSTRHFKVLVCSDPTTLVKLHFHLRPLFRRPLFRYFVPYFRPLFHYFS